METVGLGFFFEDLRVGREFRTIGRTVTEADITNFVKGNNITHLRWRHRLTMSSGF
jgi:hypothetical protein